MGKIDRLLAKPVKAMIGGVEETLMPLTVNDLPLLAKMSSKNEEVQGEALQELIRIYGRQIDPDATPEQINNISAEFMEEFMDVIFKVNGMDLDANKQKFLEEVKRRQAG